MIRQLFFLITLWWLFAYSYVIIFPLILINGRDLGNNKIVDKLSVFVKSLAQLVIYLSFTLVSKAKMFIYEIDKNIREKMNNDTDKIDIIIPNHISASDSILILPILKYFGINSYIHLYKKSIHYIPGIGIIQYAKPNIVINRNWEYDKNIITKQLDEIKFNGNKHVIIFYPEGTRKTDENFKEGQEFSKKNNYPIYNNLLVPRSKGLHLLMKHLQKNNKLGKVWDVNLINKNFNKDFNFLTDTIGSLFITIREINVPKISRNEKKFKSWLLEEWITKDNIIGNYKKYNYKKISMRKGIGYNYLCILFVAAILFFILSNKYGRYYFIFAILISYIIMLKD